MQQISFQKDQAMFADALYQRKKAVMNLVRNCGDIASASAILSEIIDSCPELGDADFMQFCLVVKSNVEESREE